MLYLISFRFAFISDGHCLNAVLSQLSQCQQPIHCFICVSIFCFVLLLVSRLHMQTWVVGERVDFARQGVNCALAHIASNDKIDQTIAG